MKRFEVGRAYSREEIHRHVGGSVESYLPTLNGRVVAGCFRRDTNPDAPCIVLPGDGPRIKGTAETFSAQQAAVPVFIKQRSFKWLYVGDYRVSRQSFSRAEILFHAKIAERSDVTSVLHLEPVAAGE